MKARSSKSYQATFLKKHGSLWYKYRGCDRSYTDCRRPHIWLRRPRCFQWIFLLRIFYHCANQYWSWSPIFRRSEKLRIHISQQCRASGYFPYPVGSVDIFLLAAAVIKCCNTFILIWQSDHSVHYSRVYTLHLFYHIRQKMLITFPYFCENKNARRNVTFGGRLGLQSPCGARWFTRYFCETA